LLLPASTQPRPPAATDYVRTWLSSIAFESHDHDSMSRAHASLVKWLITYLVQVKSPMHCQSTVLIVESPSD
jgi:hypothetical protein